MASCVTRDWVEEEVNREYRGHLVLDREQAIDIVCGISRRVKQRLQCELSRASLSSTASEPVTEPANPPSAAGHTRAKYTTLADRRGGDGRTFHCLVSSCSGEIIHDATGRPVQRTGTVYDFPGGLCPADWEAPPLPQLPRPAPPSKQGRRCPPPSDECCIGQTCVAWKAFRGLREGRPSYQARGVLCDTHREGVCTARTRLEPPMKRRRERKAGSVSLLGVRAVVVAGQARGRVTPSLQRVLRQGEEEEEDQEEEGEQSFPLLDVNWRVGDRFDVVGDGLLDSFAELARVPGGGDSYPANHPFVDYPPEHLSAVSAGLSCRRRRRHHRTVTRLSIRASPLHCHSSEPEASPSLTRPDASYRIVFRRDDG